MTLRQYIGYKDSSYLLPHTNIFISGTLSELVQQMMALNSVGEAVLVSMGHNMHICYDIGTRRSVNLDTSFVAGVIVNDL